MALWNAGSTCQGGPPARSRGSRGRRGILHDPPLAKTLARRLRDLCDFAIAPEFEGGQTAFVHPILKAIIVHFMLAYDHPFVDGNGREGRSAASCRRGSVRETQNGQDDRSDRPQRSLATSGRTRGSDPPGESETEARLAPYAFSLRTWRQAEMIASVV